MLTKAQSRRAAAALPHPKYGEAANRCPKQRFASTDGLYPVVFHIERIEEAA